MKLSTQEIIELLKISRQGLHKMVAENRLKDKLALKHLSLISIKKENRNNYYYVEPMVECNSLNDKNLIRVFKLYAWHKQCIEDLYQECGAEAFKALCHATGLNPEGVQSENIATKKLVSKI